MQLTIRDYCEEDLEQIREITIAGFDGVSIAQNMQKMLGLVGGHDWTWHKARAIEDDVNHPRMAVFVAELNARVVGVITTRVDTETGIGLIPNLAVDASVRGKGIGRQLLEHALQHFRACDLTTAHIETLEQNEIGQHLYPAIGFREIARQIHYAMDLTSGDRIE